MMSKPRCGLPDRDTKNINTGLAPFVLQGKILLKRYLIRMLCKICRQMALSSDGITLSVWETMTDGDCNFQTAEDNMTVSLYAY